MRILMLACAAVLLLASPAPAQKNASKQLKELDAYFQQARKNWDIPGMAIAIVKDGEVVHAKGYGVANVDTQAPATANTLFAVASNTKAFTSAALAMLVDEGKLSWDDKVQQYLPFFQLYDPYVSAEMTIRDLLCHRSGLATFSGDLVWYGSSYSREEVIRRARHLEPTYGFREHYGYQNIMFITAGEVVAKVSGVSWDDFIKTRFFQPMGMDRSVTTINMFPGMTDIAAPHNTNLSGEGNHTIQWVNWDNIGGAGAIVSSVNDMARWLQLQLGKGTLDSTQYWSEARTYDMWQVHTPEGISSWSRGNFPTKTFNGYGLGWELWNYHGEKIVNHGGGYDGMISKTVVVPGQDLAFVILTNNINWLASALTYKILDVYLGDKRKDTRDWARYYLDLKTQIDARDKQEQQALAEARISDTTPSLELAAYTGTYRSELYGDIEVRLIGDQLAFQFKPTPLFRGTLRHWHYDTFQLNWGTDMMLPSGTAQFVLNPQGQVAEIKIDVPNPDFDFTELKLLKVLAD